MVEIAEVLAIVRAEARRYEEEAVEHRAKTARTETKSARSKKRAQARALDQLADALAARFGGEAGVVVVSRPEGWSFASGLAFRHDETGGILRWRKDAQQWFLVEIGPGESWLVGLEAGRGDHTSPPFAEAAQILTAR